MRALPRMGFPIRTSPDQRMVSSFPGLIAAAHVLRRLLAPRHPPCALVLLIRREPVFHRYGVFKVHAEERPAGTGFSLSHHGPPKQAVSQNSTVFSTTRSTYSRRARSPDEAEAPSTGRAPTGVIAPVFPRKEVIQPQLPLRLPCYDFTPIIDPTFDGCLPCGLAHRLRVLPTFVV